jgi:hypothetical protein
MTPYISFIGFARNDDYTPDRAARHNKSLNFLIKQLRDYKIPSEIIVVEWNYPEDRPPLSKTILIETKTEFTTLRVIRVPQKFHQKYKGWQHKPFHVAAAINVGIRRAKGKFILPIASDVFLTDECLKFISSQNLDEEFFYRCDRYDVDSCVLETTGKERSNFFNFCEKNVLLHHEKLIQEPSFRIADLHINGCGDFYLVSKKALCAVRGNEEGKTVGSLDADGILIHALHGYGLREKILPDSCRVYKIFHNNSTVRVVQQIWKPWQKKLERILMRMRFSSFGINSFRIYLNYPKRSYSYASKAIFDSYEKNLVKRGRKWAKQKPPFYLNDENWGLGSENLEEVDVVPRS